MIKNIFMIFGLILAIVGFIVILSYSIDSSDWLLVVFIISGILLLLYKSKDLDDE